MAQKRTPKKAEDRINRLPENLKYYRTLRGFTQEQLAELVGISRNNLAQYENGYSEPGQNALVLFSVALECSVDQLLGTVEDDGVPHPLGVSLEDRSMIEAANPLTLDQRLELLNFAEFLIGENAEQKKNSAG